MEILLGDNDSACGGSRRYALKPIDQQVATIAESFGLSPVPALAYVEQILPKLRIPNGAMGWAAIPTVDGLMRHYHPTRNCRWRYRCALERCFEAMLSRLPMRTFWSCGDHFEKSDMSFGIRTSDRTARALDLVAEQQPGDILILPVRLGGSFGYMAPATMSQSFVGSGHQPDKLSAGDEFGLTSLAVGSILLSHPKRFLAQFTQDILCLGDEFVADPNDETFTHVPFFGVYGNEYDDYVSYAAIWLTDWSRSEIATAFIPAAP